MAQLSQDIIVQILLRLPVRSVLRFKCLSKSVRTVMDSSYFINLHRCCHNSNPSKLIFSYEYKFHVCDAKFNSEKDIILLDNPVTSQLDRVCCYCNGLFLLSRTHIRFALWNSFTLWNPSTRQSRDLPYCPFKVPTAANFYNIIGWGFGYDDFIEDYKAFLITHVERQLEPKLQVQVWIYGLKSNIWRRVQDFPYREYKNLPVSCSPETSYFADGSVHWLWTFNEVEKEEIVAFDMRKETFSLAPQPNCSIKSTTLVSKKLHLLGGCLCISYFSYWPLLAELYMRNKDGVDQFNWIKLYSVTKPTLPENLMHWLEKVNVLGYFKSRDKIMLHLNGYDGTFWYYDLKNTSFKMVKTNKLVRNWIRGILFHESLVSIGGGAF